jgi:hypothetical protein
MVNILRVYLGGERRGGTEVAHQRTIFLDPGNSIKGLGLKFTCFADNAQANTEDPLFEFHTPSEAIEIAEEFRQNIRQEHETSVFCECDMSTTGTKMRSGYMR